MIRRGFAGVILLLGSAAGHADPLQHELLVFGSAEAADTGGRGDSEDDVHALLSADVLFSLQKDHFKVFGEYLLTNHEADLERFQIGWEPTSDTVVWIGRFHQPASVWNHEHHHGRFLQTAITRPAAENWEDDAGIIPQHYVGALVESTWHLPSGHTLETSAGAGLAPVLTTRGLEPINLLQPDFRGHGFGIQGRLAFAWDELGDTGAGLLFAKGKLNVEENAAVALPGLDHVEQTMIGAYASYAHDSWKVSAVVYRIDADTIVRSMIEPASRFSVGYLQVERELSGGLHLFARDERGTNLTQSVYLSLFPHFVTSRTTLGLRWDFARRQALTVQGSNTQTRSNAYGELRIQWSAALL